MEKMAIYDATRSVPENACRRIDAGRLKGKTDINPMWRIKRLTEMFGPCGVGWKYEIVRFWSEDGAAGEKAAFAEIRLYICLLYTSQYKIHHHKNFMKGDTYGQTHPNTPPQLK